MRVYQKACDRLSEEKVKSGPQTDSRQRLCLPICGSSAVSPAAMVTRADCHLTRAKSVSVVHEYEALPATLYCLASSVNLPLIQGVLPVASCSTPWDFCLTFVLVVLSIVIVTLVILILIILPTIVVLALILILLILVGIFHVLILVVKLIFGRILVIVEGSHDWRWYIPIWQR